MTQPATDSRNHGLTPSSAIGTASPGSIGELVNLTEGFLDELHRSGRDESARCLARYLASIDESGWQIRPLRNIVEALADNVSAGSKRRPLSPPIERALEFLGQHGHESITWRDVAASVHRNQAYLARRFRHEMGVTLRQYLADLRVRRAAQLIAAGDKVEFSMLSVGYHSKRTFYSHFRHVFGVTPGSFRAVIGPSTIPVD